MPGLSLIVRIAELCRKSGLAVIRNNASTNSLFFALFSVLFAIGQNPPPPATKPPTMSSALGTKTSGIDQTFHCNDPKPATTVQPSNKHSVTLSWKAAVPRSKAAVDAIAGYNLYRLNPDGSCMQINAKPVQDTVFVDRVVELGKKYRYAAQTVDQAKRKSDFSNVVEAVIPAN